MIRRSLTALGLATVAVLGATPSVVAAEIHVGSGTIAVPEFAPVVVPAPMGLDAMALPLLPYPFVWSLHFVPAPGVAAPAPAPAPRLSGCREAWNLGVAPMHRGSEYYHTAMDGDNDGIACERDPR
ncbi:MAG: excalibur calcium-binding domain-containing protein [Dietzia sp.]